MSLFKREKAAQLRWKEMLAGGLKQDAAETENALQHAVREWSQDANLALSTVRPERVVQKGRAPEVAIHLVGAGPMSAVARFLWRLQTAPLPVKVVEMHLSARREGTDDLSLQLRLSALYLPADWKAGVAQPPSPVRAAGRTAPQPGAAVPHH